MSISEHRPAAKAVEGLAHSISRPAGMEVENFAIWIFKELDKIGSLHGGDLLPPVIDAVVATLECLKEHVQQRVRHVRVIDTLTEDVEELKRQLLTKTCETDRYLKVGVKVLEVHQIHN